MENGVEAVLLRFPFLSCKAGDPADEEDFLETFRFANAQCGGGRGGGCWWGVGLEQRPNEIRVQYRVRSQYGNMQPRVSHKKGRGGP